MNIVFPLLSILALNWTPHNSSLVRLEEDLIELSRRNGQSGWVEARLDLSSFANRKVRLTYEARIEGSVVPYFTVKLPETAEISPGVKSDTLAEFNKFGWIPYDGVYGWRYRCDAYQNMYRHYRQTYGTIFRVPEGVKSAKLIFHAEPVRYYALDRRKERPGTGKVIIENIKLVLAESDDVVAERWAAEKRWEQERLTTEEFVLLAPFYNRFMIRLNLLQGSFRQQSSIKPETEKKLKTLEASLDGMRAFYEKNITGIINKLDFSDVSAQLQEMNQDQLNPAVQNNSAIMLSILTEKMLRGGQTVDNQQLRDIRQSLDELATELNHAQAMGSPNYALMPDEPQLPRLPEPVNQPIKFSSVRGQSPFYFSTGNTAFPYRVYRDLGVDVIALNVYSSTLINSDGTIRETQRFAEKLALEAGHKVMYSFFFPAHYHFAVSNSYIAENLAKIPAMLRYDRSGNSPIRLRNAKGGREDQKKFEFLPDRYTYHLPLSMFSPDSQKLLDTRLAGIGRFVAGSSGIARIELGAEAVNLLLPAYDIHTRKAFQEYLQKRFGNIGNLNKLLRSDYASFSDCDYTKTIRDPRRRKQIDRLSREFFGRADADFYREWLTTLRTFDPDIIVSNRGNDLWFGDHAFRRAEISNDIIDYHADYDRVYGYYLGKATGKDHLTGEELVAAPAGLKDRDLSDYARMRLKINFFDRAVWGTKSLCLWNLYRPDYYTGAADANSLYSMINENYAVLPDLKHFLRRYEPVLNGEVLEPEVMIFKAENQGYSPWYMPSVYSTVSFLEARNVNFGYLFEQQLAGAAAIDDRIKLIFMPPALFMSTELQEKLLDWVRRGGSLVAFGPLGVYDEFVNPSGHFMQNVFGAGSYTLLGGREALKSFDGIYLCNWEHPQSTVLPVLPGRPLPQNTDKPSLKLFNDLGYLATWKGSSNALDLLVDRIDLAVYGKGKVMLIPREYLPNEYSDSLDTALKETLIRTIPVKSSAKDITIVVRHHRDDKGGKYWFLMVQNRNIWLPAITATLSVGRTFENITNLETGLKVPATTLSSGQTSFKASLYPGEIYVYRLD